MIERFWFSNTLFPALKLLVAPSSPVVEGDEACGLKFFDPDGRLINEAEIGAPRGVITEFELSPFLGGLSIESGMMHGQLEVASDCSTYLHASSESRAAIIPPLEPRSDGVMTMYPIKLGAEESCVTIANFSQSEAVVKAKLLIGNRSPEIAVTLPPRGTRVFSIQSEFQEVIGDKSGYAYIRLQAGFDVSIGSVLWSGVERNSLGLIF